MPVVASGNYQIPVTSSQVLARTPQAAASRRYSLLLTTDPDEVRAAQRLRHLVFADELGAVLHTPEPGLDVDRFDAHCDHLVVREDGSGEIVGTYRMLPPQRALAAGGMYSEGEFVLDELAPLRPWNPHGISRPLRAKLPALLQGYLRLGAWVCGPPAHDPDFDCADFYVLLGLDRMDARYVRFFLGGAA